jgi:hypothetical protein
MHKNFVLFCFVLSCLVCNLSWKLVILQPLPPSEPFDPNHSPSLQPFIRKQIKQYKIRDLNQGMII